MITIRSVRIIDYMYRNRRRSMMRKSFEIAGLLFALLVLSAAVSPVRAETSKEERKQEGSVVTEELIQQGKALFVGEKHFSKRGAPCVACHALRYSGVRGGNWGPDLTDMYTNMGEEGILEVLKSPPFAGMKKMYEEKPLTEEEIKALAAFAKDAAMRKEAAAPHFFPWAGIGFFGAILGIFSLYKRRVR
jgi:mono/diheme cytochrome c family protein